jgi:hypothetical protein
VLPLHPNTPQSMGDTHEAGTNIGADVDTRHTWIVSGGTQHQGAESSMSKLGSIVNISHHETLIPRKRLQDGIRKEKKYTDGMVRYGCLATSEEPSVVSAALKVTLESCNG